MEGSSNCVYVYNPSIELGVIGCPRSRQRRAWLHHRLISADYADSIKSSINNTYFSITRSVRWLLAYFPAEPRIWRENKKISPQFQSFKPSFDKSLFDTLFLPVFFYSASKFRESLLLLKINWSDLVSQRKQRGRVLISGKKAPQNLRRKKTGDKGGRSAE